MITYKTKLRVPAPDTSGLAPGLFIFKLGIKNKQELKEKLLSSISDIDLMLMLEDVRSFLIKPDDETRVLKFREYI